VSAAQWKRLSERTVYFGHQSVGANIVEGIREIEAVNPQIRLRVSSGERTAAPGVLNEFYIGRNEDPESKNDAFVAATRGAIGTQPVLMFKYCYVDVDEKTDPKKLFARYRETVEKLRAQQPNATLLHVTLPLVTEPSLARVVMNRVRGLATKREENAIRQQYNELVRATYGGKEPVFERSRCSISPRSSPRAPTARSSTAPSTGNRCLRSLANGARTAGISTKQAGAASPSNCS
jgi:hypothetical protein